MNEEQLQRFKRKIPLLNELEEKYSGGDPKLRSNWIKQNDWKSSTDQEYIKQAYRFYCLGRDALKKYKISDLEWLIKIGFLGYDEVLNNRKDKSNGTRILLDELLIHLRVETDEEWEERMKANRSIFADIYNNLP